MPNDVSSRSTTSEPDRGARWRAIAVIVVAALVLPVSAFVVNSDTNAPDYPGQPREGTLYWGATVGFNDDPVERHEQYTDNPLGVRRTYFSWSQRESSWMQNIVADDVATGRLPWVSFKTPPWREVADGHYDDEIDQLLAFLDNQDGPVWMTFHHEPENDLLVGTPADHVAMNGHVRDRMSALGTDNIALAPVLMSWTWEDLSGRDPEDWWEPGIYDFLGVDHYEHAGTPLTEDPWPEIRQWAGAKGVDLAVGEWGFRDTWADPGPALMEEWYNRIADSGTDGRGARVVGAAVFDTNHGLQTELVEPSLGRFRELMDDPRSVNQHTPTPEPTPTPTPDPTPTPEPTPTPTPEPTPTPTPEPTPTLTPTPEPSPTASPTPEPSPTASPTPEPSPTPSSSPSPDDEDDKPPPKCRGKHKGHDKWDCPPDDDASEEPTPSVTPTLGTPPDDE